MRFEWDERKNTGNVRKHGVSFGEAQTVFFDEEATEFHDPDHSMDEERFILLGLSAGLRALVVCYSFREEDFVVRIISARRATSRERRFLSRGRA